MNVTQKEDNDGSITDMHNAAMQGSQQSDEDQEVVVERHGFGINKWKSGAVYEGEWLNDKTHGKGIFWHSGGDIYIGEF